ncbi:uncharacterized protein LOC128265531 [Drosophila gunungcola]|uniref:Uncharacterized protein n=1 Tax=Drosophila gunungcola TaxID=103775 RepID=A0A9Q0BIU4_9MUSC|nr:uncharacterized protein LOC128265531 [Drosophila gunungcola]KAI8033486.1 hypothetical protein M5D96_013760 [Drosophila gunungcola]
MKVDKRMVFLCMCFIAMWQFSSCLGAKDCLKLHNLTSSKVEAVALTTHFAAVPLDVKCYSGCVIEEYFGDDGKIDLQRVGNRGTEQEQTILAQCKQQFDGVNNLGRCDYPYLMLQCLFMGKASGTIAP